MSKGCCLDGLRGCLAGVQGLLEPTTPAGDGSQRHRSESALSTASSSAPQPEPEIHSTELPEDWWTPPANPLRKVPSRGQNLGRGLPLGPLGTIEEIPAGLASQATDDSKLRGIREEAKGKMKLVSSMPVFLDYAEEDQDSGPMGQRRTLAAAVEEQLIELKLPEGDAVNFEGMQASGTAVVVFCQVKGEGGAVADAEFVLQESDDLERVSFSMPFSATKLPVGLYKFHFLLDGTRVCSSAYPIIDNQNVAILSDPLRKYIVNRGQSSPEEDNEILHKNSQLTLELPSTKDGPNLLERRRVASYSQGLNNLARTDKAAMQTSIGMNVREVKESRKRGRIFSENVFAGLYDNGLSLFLQPSWHNVWAASATSRNMQFWAGSARMGKQRGQCEDACFVSTSAVGVADGVGGMSAFSAYGVNSAKMAWELMKFARRACLDLQSQSPDMSPQERSFEAMRKAEASLEACGASTICVASLKNSELGVANLGDSGFMVLRRGKQRLEIVKRSIEQHHRWNCPYQLTRLPPALQRQFPDFACDTPSDGDQYTFQLQEGDLLLLFTDGMRDNLHDNEILAIAECALPPGVSQLVGLQEYKSAPETIAKALSIAAYERSIDRKAKVPFAESCRQNGYDYEGGKEDDITVVVAWAMQEKTPGLRPHPDSPNRELFEASAKSQSGAVAGGLRRCK